MESYSEFKLANMKNNKKKHSLLIFVYRIHSNNIFQI